MIVTLDIKLLVCLNVFLDLMLLVALGLLFGIAGVFVNSMFLRVRAHLFDYISIRL